MEYDLKNAGAVELWLLRRWNQGRRNMEIKRRDFVKGCAAASALLLAGIDSVAKGENANNAPASGADSCIEKSIKASFGGGFSVRAHTQSDGLTYADIEHLGNHYAVVSADLLDWKIVRSSLNNPGYAFSAVSRSSISMV